MATSQENKGRRDTTFNNNSEYLYKWSQTLSKRGGRDHGQQNEHTDKGNSCISYDIDDIFVVLACQLCAFQTKH